MLNGIKLVCLYGTESTGKSTVAKRLAEIYETEFVPEVSKEIISSNNFTIEDIVRIAHEQVKRTKEKSKTANKILFCDTDVITTQIYSQHYLGMVPPILHALEKKIQYDRYFLFDIDVPWVADGLRDLGERRKEMFDRFQLELDRRKIDYQVISGAYAEREKHIRKIIDEMLW